ncbi:hypothetical protein PVAP13_5KG054250 [Panicum virgatum]|uniref:Uncharacterized protein n=1 Tax=Panicum virgatum TaxID=38727 RepID=A0A8T0SE20_PANVG|nr:hypothetical protein PVAP13_5KG054250 [Panicum virgatum]
MGATRIAERCWASGTWAPSWSDLVDFDLCLVQLGLNLRLALKQEGICLKRNLPTALCCTAPFALGRKQALGFTPASLSVQHHALSWQKGSSFEHKASAICPSCQPDSP